MRILCGETSFRIVTHYSKAYGLYNDKSTSLPSKINGCITDLKPRKTDIYDGILITELM